MATPVTDPHGPGGGVTNNTGSPSASGETISAQLASGAVDSTRDTRVLCVPSENIATSGGGANPDGVVAVQPALAVYVQDGSTIKRTYMRPTEFVNCKVNGKTTDTIDFLDSFKVTGTLRWRAADSNGIPAQTESVNVIVTRDHAPDAGKEVARGSTTVDESGDFEFEFQDADIYPGSNGEHTITLSHDPRGKEVWQAPDETLKLKVVPIQMGVQVNHPWGNAPNQPDRRPKALGTNQEPFIASDSHHVPVPSLLYNPGPHASSDPKVGSKVPWTWLTLAASVAGSSRPNAAKFDEMDDAGLLDQIWLDMAAMIEGDGSSRISGHDGDWLNLGGTPDPQAFAKANAWYNSHGGGRADMGSHSWSESGISAMQGIPDAILISADTMGITVSPVGTPAADYTRMNDLLNKNTLVYFVIFARVQDDRTSRNRWVGGAFDSPSANSLGNFHPHQWQASFSPYTYKKGANSSGTGGGGATSSQQSHQSTGGSHVASSVTMRATSATGGNEVRGGTAYFGTAYTHRGGSTVHLAKSSSLTASRVTGGTLTFRTIHTFMFAGATIHLDFGNGQGWTGKVPYSGAVTIRLSQAEARAIAATGTIHFDSGGGQSNYGYYSWGTVKVVLNQK